jgi:cbb3-type cytochrome c oxidase subunit III
LRRTRRFTISGAGLAAIAAVTLLASGCGYGGVASAADHPDPQNGQAQFATNCGYCHTLQAAGTNGTIGPDLDNAFAGDRKQGYADTDIENVVLDQIRLGSGPIATYTTAEHGVKGLTPATPMPANRVTGQNAIDVAAYVASVAGINGYVQPVNLASLKTGAAIFKLGPCSSCHALKAAGSKGNPSGPGSPPNLDSIASQLTVPIVIRQVTNGGASMPAFGSQLTPAQIKAVAQYVVSVAGK